MSSGTLVFVGMGLYDETDISLKGLQALQACDRVFAELYTSQMNDTAIQRIEQQLGKPVKALTRQQTEDGRIILDAACDKDVVFLVGGDPMIATTHVDLRIRAHQQGIPTRVIHCSSIVTAVPGLLGLQNYKFGRTTTLAYPEKNYFPTSPYEVIQQNQQMGLHTLVLLDIQAENQRFMTANEGLKLLLQMEEHHHASVITDDALACVVGRAGSDQPVIKADVIGSLRKQDFGPPLHALVVPGSLHFMEYDALVELAGLPEEIAQERQKL